MTSNAVAPQPSGTSCYDVAVVGGGIVGLATAMAMARAGCRSLVVIEAEGRLAAHQTGNNSGVIHSGLYYKPGSLKAKLCAEGRKALYQFCQERGVPCESCGKIVVATREEELGGLDELQQRGEANGLAGLRRLSIEELREHEPNVAGIAGLFVRETGIVDYVRVTEEYAAVVRQCGGEVRTSARLVGVTRRGEEIVLGTTEGEICCRGLVNCAGLQCDRVARICGVEPQVRIIPFRGEYYKLAPEAWGLVRNLIYPVPDPAFPFLGVHFTRMVKGGVEAGPNAVLAFAREGYSWTRIDPKDVWDTLSFPGFWRMAGKYWRAGFGEMHRSLSKKAFLEALQRLLPALKLEDLREGGAGVRAQAMEPTGAMVDDFRVQQADRMVHVLNAPSPAATASISIGQHIAEIAARCTGFPKARPS